MAPLTQHEREELLQVSKLRSTPQSVALRVRIVQSAAEGIANKVLTRQLEITGGGEKFTMKRSRNSKQTRPSGSKANIEVELPCEVHGRHRQWWVKILPDGGEMTCGKRKPNPERQIN